MSDGERGHGSVMPENMGRACLSASSSCSINFPPAPLTAPTPFRRVGNSPWPDTRTCGPMKHTDSRAAARRGKWLTRTGTGGYRTEDARIGQPLMTLPGTRNASRRLSLFPFPKNADGLPQSRIVLSARYSRTLRRVLEYVPQSTPTRSARPCPRSCTPPPSRQPG